MLVPDPLVHTLIEAVMAALQQSGAADRQRTFRMRLLPPARWALDFYTPDGARRTLMMELPPPTEDDEAPLE